jgi:hypothetical protein
MQNKVYKLKGRGTRNISQSWGIGNDKKKARGKQGAMKQKGGNLTKV